MEPISEAWSSEQRSRGAEEIITIGNLSRNCVQAALGLWKGPRLPGGGEKNKQIFREREFITVLLMTKHSICTVKVLFLLTLLELEYFIASKNRLHATSWLDTGFKMENKRMYPSCILFSIIPAGNGPATAPVFTLTRQRWSHAGQSLGICGNQSASTCL